MAIDIYTGVNDVGFESDSLKLDTTRFSPLPKKRE